MGKTINDFKAKEGTPSTTEAGFEKNVKHTHRVRPKTIPYQRNRWGRGSAAGWQTCIYDLAEISRVADIESALSVSFRKHRELLLKEGFYLESKNVRVIRRVQRRINEIELQSGRSFESIIRELATNLIKFHTAFLYMRRDANRSTGARTRMFGKEREPIAALEPIDPSTMEAKQNKSGRIIIWRQHVPEQGQEVEFDPTEVLVVTMDKKTGFIFGTPYCLPVLDDIIALRRLEELIDVITSKHAFPLYHYQVGTENSPAIEMSDGVDGMLSEVDIVRAEIEGLPTEGAIVTSERHNLTVIGAEGQAIDLSPYLEHFEQRMLGGLRLSGIDLGRGGTSNRGTATTISKNLAEAVKDYQTVISDGVTTYLLNEIVLEEGFDLNEENKVFLRFPAVDRDEARAQENHLMTLYQGHIITETEARQSLGKDPISDTQRSETYLKLVELPLAKAKKADNKSSSGAKGTAKSRAKPTNQSGSKAKPRTPKNDMLNMFRVIFNNLKVSIASIDLNDEERLKEVLGNSSRQLLIMLTPYLNEAIDNGSSTISGSSGVNFEIKSDFLKKIAKKELRKLFQRIKLSISDISKEITLMNAMSAIEPIALTNLDMLGRMAFSFGAVEAAKLNGQTKLKLGENEIDLTKANVRDLARLPEMLNA